MKAVLVCSASLVCAVAQSMRGVGASAGARRRKRPPACRPGCAESCAGRGSRRLRRIALRQGARHSGAHRHASPPSRRRFGRASPFMLVWHTENPASVTIDPEPGRVTPRGTRQLKPTATTTYTLTVRGPNDQVLTKSVTVNVAGTVPAGRCGGQQEQAGAADRRRQAGPVRRLHRPGRRWWGARRPWRAARPVLPPLRPARC